MALLFTFERRGYVNAVAVRVLLKHETASGSVELWVATDGKVGKAFKELFESKRSVEKVDKDEAISVTKALIHKNAEYTYVLNMTNFKGDYHLSKFKSLQWIESKIKEDPSRAKISRKVYKKIFYSMFEKETKNLVGVNGKYKLAENIFDNIIKLASFEIDDSLPF